MCGGCRLIVAVDCINCEATGLVHSPTKVHPRISTNRYVAGCPTCGGWGFLSIDPETP